MGENPDAAVLRAARLLGRIVGFVPALLAVASREAPERVPLLSESEICAIADELQVPGKMPLADLKIAIADAIPNALDEAVLRAAGRMSTVPPRSRGEATVRILRGLGAP